MTHKTDAQIAKEATLEPIQSIAETLGLLPTDIESYGHTKAKIPPAALARLPNKNGKVILVTAISPTPAGEGKTTVTIGLADALNHLFKTNQSTQKTAMIAIREPSLGPVFGIKGGAAGGGLAQVLPMEDINLHFTGDLHAIGAANNLLAAMIDNHIFHGNALNIDPERVLWRRALDMNDRQLRMIESGLTGGKTSNGTPRLDGFDITVASEVMACFCLAGDLMDLKQRLGNMLVAYSKAGEPIFAKDLQADGAMTALLKDAFKPNLVQTIFHTPALVHGGPFANIAHGCNSVVATKMAAHLADVVVTEAGFGADLGAEKFCDIKCRMAEIRPSACVIVATVRALKYHGNVAKESLSTPNLSALKAGLANLLKHIDNMQTVFGLPVVIAINRFSHDSDEEIDAIIQGCHAKNVSSALCDVWANGAIGGIDLAQKVMQAMDMPNDFKFAYDSKLPILQKIQTLACRIYGAKDIMLSEHAKQSLAQMQTIANIRLDDLPICMAKTPYSFSDDAKLLGAPSDFTLTITDLTLSNGAGFVVVLCGNVMKMPGLPKTPAAANIDVNAQGDITGLF